MTALESNIPLILSGLAFLVVCLVFAGVFIHLSRVQEKKERVKKIRAEENQWSSMAPFSQEPGQTEKPGGIFTNFLASMGMKIMSGKPEKDAGKRLKLVRAGLRGENALSIFWGAKILLAALLGLSFVVFAVLFLKTLNALILVYLVILVAGLGWFFPDIWLRVRTGKRKTKITRGFPDALDLLVVCVEAGMGLDQSIHRVGEEIGLTHPELADEFKLLNLELRAGKARTSALRNLATRTDIDDVKSLSTLLIQTDRFGTSIAQALRVYSDTFRTTRQQRAEELAAKMGTKLIFPLAFCFFPSFFIMAIGSALIQVFRVFMDK